MFRFKSSKRSNNGTDVGSGQIPEILYRIPEIEKETGVPILLLDKTFSSSVSPVSNHDNIHMYYLTEPKHTSCNYPSPCTLYMFHLLKHTLCDVNVLY